MTLRAPLRSTDVVRAACASSVAVALAVALALAGGACGGAPTPPPSVRPLSDALPPHPAEERALEPVRVVWTQDLSADARCDDAHLEIVLPFLEGLHIAHPAAALPATGYAATQLAYPGALSAPLVLWSCDGATWTAAYTHELVDAPPVDVTVKTHDGKTELGLACRSACSLRTLTAHGTWADAARAVVAAWSVPTTATPLASRYRELHYFVHRFLDTSTAPPADGRRVDWTDDALAARLPKEPSDALVQLYGLDWGGVDLAGAYLWSEGAEATWKRLRDANPKLAHLSWLNLRTYKYAVPPMGIEQPIPEAVALAEAQYEGGPREVDQYGFKAKEMCLASPYWQASRRAELEHLVREGFRVVQLDEFPIPTTWDGAPCRATTHLHKPGDAADQWRVTRKFIVGLATYARAHDVLLTTEEPSAALLGLVSADTDGIYNEPPDVYGFWTKSPDIRPVPLFSTMFGRVMTPYTRADVKRPPPAGWLPEWKASRDARPR